MRSPVTWNRFRGLAGGWITAALTALFLVLPARPALAAPPAKAQPAKIIDLAICLDTSNSMDGLIDSAKRKLWDIVNDLARVKPTPTLRVALYSYGNDGYDPKTGWVRKELDLTTDLDKVSEKLFGLTTNGGEEYVARVCRDAIDQLKWSEDAGALKLIFVCGNEPANQDPQVALKSVAEKAVRKDIIINTIFCGNPSEADAASWKEFARLSEGRFAAINQDGAVAIATPWDKELTDLGGKLNSTFCFCGKDAKELTANQARQDANNAGLGTASAAARVQSKGSALYRFEDDLVEKLKADPKFDVKKMPEKELPDELKKMSPEAREKHLKDLLAKREALHKQIGELAKKREAYIQQEMKKNASKADKAFDEVFRVLVRDQAKKKGIDIPE